MEAGENREVDVSERASELRGTYKMLWTALSNSEKALKIYPVGTIEQGINQEERDVFHKFLPTVLDVLPEAILLGGSRAVYLEFRMDSKTTPFNKIMMTSDPKKRYYLPKTDEMFTFKRFLAMFNEGHEPEDFDPQSQTFVGFEHLREREFRGADITKPEVEEGKLSLDDIEEILKEVEKTGNNEYLVDLKFVRQELQAIESTRQERIEQAQQEYGADIQRRTANFIRAVLNPPGISDFKFVPRVIRLGQYAHEEGVPISDCYYSPYENKLAVVPFATKKLLWIETRLPDFSRSKDADVKDWSKFGKRLAYDLLNYVPTKYRKILEKEMMFSLNA